MCKIGGPKGIARSRDREEVLTPFWGSKNVKSITGAILIRTKTMSEGYRGRILRRLALIGEISE
jgi:hypothetical protein